MHIAIKAPADTEDA